MEKIQVKNMDGIMEEFDIVNSFGIGEMNRNFVILSKGESAGEGLSKVYISEVIEESPNVYKMVGITDEDVWDKVKQAMKEIVQGG